MWYDVGDTIKIDLELNRNCFEEYELVCPFVKVWTVYDSNCDRVVYAYANFYNLRTHEISRRIPHFFNPEHSTLAARASLIATELADATVSAMTAFRDFRVALSTDALEPASTPDEVMDAMLNLDANLPMRRQA